MVTDGSYSDYHVIGVYSTIELAEEARLLYKSENAVEAIELDNLPVHPPGHFPWEVRMDLEGNVDDIRRISPDFYHKWQPCYSHPNLNEKRGQYPYFRFLFNMWATDKDHAVKIAGEYRRQVIQEAGEIDWNDSHDTYAFWVKNTGQPVREQEPSSYDKLVALNKSIQNENT